MKKFGLFILGCLLSISAVAQNDIETYISTKEAISL